MPRSRQASIVKATRHLSAADPVMRRLIRKVGPCRLVLEKNRFGMLVRSIIGQQISTKAARSIHLHLKDLIGPGNMTPESILGKSRPQLRRIGISARKAGYLHDLAGKCCDGTLNLSQIGRFGDDDIISKLQTVRGVGVWTAQMFLMFSLGRPDVFPLGDLGILKAIHNLYGLKKLPDRNQAQEIADRWKPYSTIACWYCWRSLDAD